MKITTLRIIDLWVGRPICWLLTVAYKLKRIFVKKERSGDPESILFIKLFGAGSIVLAYPTIKAARYRFPEARIYFLTFRSNREVLALFGIIAPDDVYTVRDDTLQHLIIDVARCLKALISKRIDVIIDLEFFSRFTAILSFALRSRFRIGFYGFHAEGLKRGSFINYPVNYNHTLHTSKAFFTLLKPLGIPAKDFSPGLPRVPATAAGIKKVAALLDQEGEKTLQDGGMRWVVINPNTSDLIPLRKWPADYFVKLASLLLDKVDSCGVIFIGSASERSYVETLVIRVKESGRTGRVVNLAGRTSISGLIDIFQYADLFITNDSGPAHLAALTPIPVIVLFGPETPELYSPLAERVECLYLGLDCQPCVTIYNGKYSYCTDNQCLKMIAPEQVREVAIRMLAERAGRKSDDRLL